MKIVLLSPHFAPEFEGGTELVVRAQALALMRLGHQVRVISGSDELHGGAERVRARVEGLEVLFLPRLESERYDLTLERPRLMALLEAECAGADLVHAHHWSTLDGGLVQRLSRKRPVVLSLHDLFVTCPRFFRVPHPSVDHCPPQGWELASCVRCVLPDAGGTPEAELELGLEARRRNYQSELEAAAQVIVPSQAHLEALERFVELPASTSILPHGLCTQPGSLAPLEIPSRFTQAQPLRVLYLGHRSRVKGVLDLLEALAGLPRADLERVHLLMLGSALEPGFDELLRERAGQLSMELGSAYEPSELAQRVAAMGGAHLAALPSQVSESYGLVTDEAMGLGLPVWVSDLGAPAERVGAGGKVLPARDPGAWGSALSAWLAAPDLLKEARRALPISPRNADTAAQDLEQIYRRLLSVT